MRAIDTVCRTPPGQATVSLRGASGKLHCFTAFPLSEAPCGPAVYVFARPAVDPNCPTSPGWVFLGIGENGDMREWAENRHGRVVDGLTLGATHLLLHFCRRETEHRRLILGDLADSLKLEVRPAPTVSRAA